MMQTIQSFKEDKLMRRKEIMALFGIKHVNTYYKVMKESKLGGIKLGGMYVFWRSDIMAYLKAKKRVAF